MTASPAAEGLITVDLDALAANFRLLAVLAPEAEVAPVVKADAYGLGARAVARRLWAEGARRFFVARLSEGESLREDLGPARAATIYILDGCAGADRLLDAGLTPVLNSLPQVEAWGAMARARRGMLGAALHIDTGMNRLGLRIEEARTLLDASDRFDGVEVELVMSHLACADQPDHPMSARQAQAFTEAAALFPDARASLANSAGVFLGEAYHHDLVRPGISLYGGGPFAASDDRLRPVVTYQAPVLQVRSVRPGETVGYGAVWTADQPTRIAILGAGYADGVLRSSGAGGHVWLGGRRCPFLGRVSMDMVAVDITACEAQVGDMAELIGPNRPLDDVAAVSGTIAYELLTRLSSRAQRVYRGEAA